MGIELLMDLPEGYSIKDKPHFVYLFSGTEIIAVFSAEGATAESIETEAWRHYKDKEEKLKKEA